MSRVIRFRAWDNCEGKMIHQDESEYSFEMIGCGGICVSTYNTGRVVIDAEVMQFTGLTDRNGVEIYESDLIEVCGNKNGALTVEFTNAYVGGWVLTHKSSDNHLSLGARKQETIEVIGNIYQDSHLLNDKPQA